MRLSAAKMAFHQVSDCEDKVSVQSWLPEFSQALHICLSRKSSLSRLQMYLYVQVAFAPGPVAMRTSFSERHWLGQKSVLQKHSRFARLHHWLTRNEAHLFGEDTAIVSIASLHDVHDVSNIGKASCTLRHRYDPIFVCHNKMSILTLERPAVPCTFVAIQPSSAIPRCQYQSKKESKSLSR